MAAQPRLPCWHLDGRTAPPPTSSPVLWFSPERTRWTRPRVPAVSDAGVELSKGGAFVLQIRSALLGCRCAAALPWTGALLSSLSVTVARTQRSREGWVWD
eukprot:2775768-Prymnesium_polylepis.1